MRRAAVAPFLIVVMAATLAAQHQAASDVSSQSPVFRSGAQLVPLSVTVTDANRRFVRGLTLADFAVFEDGVQQEVQFFEAADVPLDLVILLDTSSSMSDKMDVVHEAAIGFLNTLRPGDRGAIVAFADGVDILQQLTGDRQTLEAAVRRTAARGATSLYNALYVSLKEFGRTPGGDEEIRRQAIAVLSDGEDTSSLVTFDDVLAASRSSGVSIYPIALHSKQAATRQASSSPRRSFSQSEYSLRVLAQETGAQAFFPLHIAELKGIYAAIAQELSSQYSLAYAPANSRADGRYRRITVRVSERPELRLRTRTGYTVGLARVATTSMTYPER